MILETLLYIYLYKDFVSTQVNFHTTRVQKIY